MSVKSRVKVFCEHLKISVSTFEKSINVSNGYVNSISKSIGLEKISTILENYSTLNLEWLLTGQGDMLKSTLSTNIVNEPAALYNNLTPQVVTVDNQGNDNIIMVSVKAQAGYLNGYSDPQFIEKLPTYRLPNISNGVFRMFQIKGHSMNPTLHQGSYVAAQFVDNWVDDIKDNRIYIVVSQEDGVVAKRCLNRIKKYNNLFCKSDNRKEYPSYNIEVEDIKEVWEVKGAFLFDLPDPADLFYRVDDLEAELYQLQTVVKKKDAK